MEEIFNATIASIQPVNKYFSDVVQEVIVYL